MNLEKSPRIIRRLAGIGRMGIAVNTYYDWANPKSPRYKPDIPKLFKIGGPGSFASGFIDSELDGYINRLDNQHGSCEGGLQ
jgi:prophage regulatory protein